MKKSLVLMFHEINDVVWFEGILQFLGRRYTFVSYDEFSKHIYTRSNKKNLLHITFDDGHKSFYENAYTVLKKMNIPATLFVSASAIQEEKNFWFQRIRPFDKVKWKEHVVSKTSHMFSGDISGFSAHAIMKSLPIEKMHEIIESFEKANDLLPAPYINVNVDELVEMHESGIIEIGAHTLNHPILANETDDNSRNEIMASVDSLNKLLSYQTRCFAYPNGLPEHDFEKREMQTLKDAGIEIAFSTEPDFVSARFNKMSIPRVGVMKGGHFFITQKIRFARQWEGIRNIVFGKSELKDRKDLMKIRKTL